MLLYTSNSQKYVLKDSGDQTQIQGVTGGRENSSCWRVTPTHT